MYKILLKFRKNNNTEISIILLYCQQKEFIENKTINNVVMYQNQSFPYPYMVIHLTFFIQNFVCFILFSFFH